MRILTTLALTAALIGCTRQGDDTGLEDTAITQDTDSDGDGTPDAEDAFPDDPDETTDSDGDGTGDNADAFPEDASETTDSDDDGVGDNADAFPNDAAETTDSDADGVGDNADAFPNDAAETTDTDADGVGDNADNCINAENADQADADEDGVGDICEGDRDSDGVVDDEDAFPDDPNETLDSDSDGVGDNADAFPNDASETLDSDSDGVGDNADAFPNDASETLDSDSDGVGDNADAFPNDASETLDSDSDGVGDNADAFPNDASETLDSDSDGVGDNADAFPNDASETLDSDSDGVGDNADAFPNDASETLDSDSDGVGDNADAFPNDASETLDSDSDGVGDNSDNCVNAANEDQANLDGDALGNVCDDDRDGDGVNNSSDAFPDDKDETKDSDSDGVGDNADAFPNDASETEDSDLDGSGDNADCDDANPQIYPGATESCNDLDDNCSGTADDGTALGSADTCGAASCLEIKQENSSASDGSYWLEPNSSEMPFQAYCDMTTDGGGYSYVKVSLPISVGAAQAEEACDVLGMDLFVPRTEAHKNASLDLANSADVAVYRPEDLSNTTGEASLNYMYILGIYPDESGVNLGYGGSVCTRIPFNSLDGGCAVWNPNDEGPYFVSTRTNIAEPNGDNIDTASMYYAWTASGDGWEISHYNDIPAGGVGYTSSRFMCDVGDKWGDGVER